MPGAGFTKRLLVLQTYGRKLDLSQSSYVRLKLILSLIYIEKIGQQIIDLSPSLTYYDTLVNTGVNVTLILVGVTVRFRRKVSS